ncbi:NRDE family protein [Candidatus Rariloculus sp.]|uniref:NRDE family protein n=1 Tax=Candidatus Rariloculus sp. TaxID=3101265 RepID=UPI003D09F1D5
MCLIVVAHRINDRHALVVAANRDEHHARPSSAAGWWSDAPDMLGGRDLSAGGTWLAMDRSGRFAAVTNFYEPGTPAAKMSRGMLATDYLRARGPLEGYSRDLARRGTDYGPFNLLLFDGAALHYVSNRASPAELPAGIHGLSNNRLGTEWPKVQRAVRGLAAAVDAENPVEPLFELLAERRRSPTDERRYTEDLFIVGPEYGTRSSTVVLIRRDGEAMLAERRFDADANCIGESRVRFSIRRNAGAGANLTRA